VRYWGTDGSCYRLTQQAGMFQTQWKVEKEPHRQVNALAAAPKWLHSSLPLSFFSFGCDSAGHGPAPLSDTRPRFTPHPEHADRLSHTRPRPPLPREPLLPSFAGPGRGVEGLRIRGEPPRRKLEIRKFRQSGEGGIHPRGKRRLSRPVLSLCQERGSICHMCVASSSDRARSCRTERG